MAPGKQWIDRSVFPFLFFLVCSFDLTCGYFCFLVGRGVFFYFLISLFFLFFSFYSLKSTGGDRIVLFRHFVGSNPARETAGTARQVIFESIAQSESDRESKTDNADETNAASKEG